ncbi:MAG: hypothetical protein JSU63_17510 [Phycisphaerales bacterium]|nr:MAG: hypothetical protein JSU63_17510 [Phycisphaerales bacterium]
MIRSTIADLVWLSIACVLAGGCASPQPSAVSFGVAHLQGASLQAVFEAAELALADLGYQIEQRDEEADVLTEKPITAVQADQGSGRPTRLSTAGETRRIAELKLRQANSGVSVYCRVVVQEQTTQAHRLHAQSSSADDVPTETAIERDAATTARQNTVWRTIRPHKPAQRQILSLITERIGGDTP